MMRGRQPPTHYSVHGSPVRNVATSLQLGAWVSMYLSRNWLLAASNQYMAAPCTVRSLELPVGAEVERALGLGGALEVPT